MLRASRRTFIKAATAASVLRCAAAGAARQPNLIVVMADDLSAHELGCYGNLEHATPNLDALARGGLKIETCWATPICSPTRAEVLTGRYGCHTGWYHNAMKPAEGEPGYNLAHSNRLFSQLLKQAGYATAICGKWQLPGTPAEHHFDEFCLWEEYSGYNGPVETATNGISVGRTARYWHPAIVENGTPVLTSVDDYGPDIFTDFLLDFARRQRERAFLALYTMPLPHTAWDFASQREIHLDVPEIQGLERVPGARRAGSLKSNLEYIDTLVGRIVRGLEQLDLREQTVLLFTSDNGSAGYGKNDTVRERGPRVPLIVNGPTRVAAQGASDALIDLSDLLPTFLELAGSSLPFAYAIDGWSFAPLLAGPGRGRRDWIFSCLGDRRFLRTRRWLLDGDRRLWDCGERRDEKGYVNVTRVDIHEVRVAKRRLNQILEALPPPRPDQVRLAWQQSMHLLPRPLTIKGEL
jgi:arylsulfatase A